MKLWILIGALVSGALQANPQKAPETFVSQKGKAVFVDFLKAEYKVVYDVKNQTALVRSVITFHQSKEGKPVFDLIEKPEAATINKQEVKIASIEDPDRQTNYRLVDKNLSAGTHVLTLESEIKKNIKFGKNSVASGFWMSDLTDRKYLEQYLPSNMEYDQYEMVLNVEARNASASHEIFANGDVSQKEKNKFQINFPSYFTTSSVFFHLSEKGRFKRKTFAFSSINGKKVPVVAYSKSSFSLINIEGKVTKILEELETKFGAWGHPSLTVYISGTGGMEHSGATITSLWALGHELTHSYFARGVMPIDGNSGWLDEAIASWRDGGYKASKEPFYSSAKMAGFSQYKRTTDKKAYSEGASFMAFLNHELKGQGGLREFLSALYKNYNHKNLNTLIFEKELEEFSGRDFEAEFNRYVFGGQALSGPEDKSGEKENPFHPKLSKQELLDLL